MHFCRSIIQAVSSKTGELVGTFHGHSGAVSSIRQVNTSAPKSNPFEKSDIYVVSSSLDGTLCLWNLVRIDLQISPRLHLIFHLYQTTFAALATYKISSPVYDILLLDSIVDIAKLQAKATAASIEKTSSKSPPASHIEVYLVINNNIGAEVTDKNTVKVVVYDLLSEKVRLYFHRDSCFVSSVFFLLF